jgi:hypothetical protein
VKKAIAMALVLLLAACRSEIGLQRSGGDDEPKHAIEVWPPVLDLGERDKGASASGRVKVRNIGEVDLRVRGLDLSGSAAWGLLDPPELPTTVAPGGTLDVRVRFAPEAPYRRIAELVVKSDAPAGREVVELVGRGTPPSTVVEGVDLGEHAVACGPVVGLVRVSNAGGHDLKLYEPRLSGDEQVVLGETDWPRTVVPGGQITVPVVYTPDRAGTAGAWLEFRTNDLPAVWFGGEVMASGVWASPYRVESFAVTERAVDILLAVDRSGSMRDDNAAVHMAARNLVGALPELSPDFHLGVVTGVSTCFNDTLFTPESEDLEDRVIEAMQGPGSPRTEALLGLARDAVLSDCNVGFLRAGSPLQLVVISDEPEQSDSGWGPLVEQIRLMLADPDDLHVSGVVDADDLCGEGAEGYLEAAAATDGVIADICAPELIVTVLDLLVPAQTGVDLFPLVEVPLPDTVAVFVNGERTEDWEWDVTRSAVRLGSTPDAGSEVTIEYRPDGGCG